MLKSMTTSSNGLPRSSFVLFYIYIKIHSNILEKLFINSNLISLLFTKEKKIVVGIIIK